jgi:nitroreductase
MTAKEGKRIELPVVTGYGGFPLEQALGTRRSVRDYTDDKLDIVVISKLLWSAQGVTESKYGLRTAPSAGATYPLELYVATEEFLARYDPLKHDLTVTLEGDVRAALAGAALGQQWVEKAPAVFVFAAVVSRTAARYGGRAGSVAVGAYDDDDVKDVLQLPEEQEVYLIVPVGRPAE